MKALFDYNPNEDKAIPCKEAGLPFRKGDILQIMTQDDATWWQAKMESDANPRAGLVPSKHFQERYVITDPIPHPHSSTLKNMISITITAALECSTKPELGMLAREFREFLK